MSCQSETHGRRCFYRKFGQADFHCAARLAGWLASHQFCRALCSPWLTAVRESEALRKHRCLVSPWRTLYGAVRLSFESQIPVFLVGIFFGPLSTSILDLEHNNCIFTCSKFALCQHQFWVTIVFHKCKEKKKKKKIWSVKNNDNTFINAQSDAQINNTLPPPWWVASC